MNSGFTKASIMTLKHYSDLIRNLPFLDQAFETKKSTWEADCADIRFNEFFQKKFQETTVRISRRDLFHQCEGDSYTGIISIIFWGYPRNMRGSHFSNILDSIQKIEKIISNQRHLNSSGFKTITDELKGTGMGLSTLTKLLYFFRFTLEGYQCLIFDKRIIEVLNKKRYKELIELSGISEYNKNDRYCHYLKVMHENSEALSVKPDQLELFLFQFGNNLKSETNYQ